MEVGRTTDNPYTYTMTESHVNQYGSVHSYFEKLIFTLKIFYKILFIQLFYL